MVSTSREFVKGVCCLINMNRGDWKKGKREEIISFLKAKRTVWLGQVLYKMRHRDERDYLGNIHELLGPMSVI